MLNDQINFWLNDQSKSFIPIGGRLRKLPNENILGYGAREIAGWLANDIQYDIQSVDSWIKNLTSLALGEITDGNFGIGNAHWVMVTKGNVFIGCEYVEEQQILLTIEQTLYILEQYRTFLQSSYKNPDIIPDAIDIEYIAEGKEAIALYESLGGAYCLPY